MGLKVTIRPIISDIDQIYEPEKEEDRKPCIGEIPGMITVTRLGGSDGDDARDIPNAFGERLSRVNWITAPRWENLATVHLTVCSAVFSNPWACKAHWLTNKTVWK